MKKEYTYLLLLAFMLCSCASASQEDLKNANYHYQLGISYLNDNNIQPAFVEFQKALELNPKDKEIHQALGVIYLTKLEDFPKAIHHFEKALDIDENFSEAANNLGNAYARIGSYADAMKAYKTALSNPQYQNASMALHNLGMVYYRLSKFDDALDAFKEAIKRYSNFHVPYYGLALCFNAKGQYGDSGAAMTRAVELDPLYKGNKEKAIQDMKDRKLRARGLEEKDLADYLDIIKY